MISQRVGPYRTLEATIGALGAAGRSWRCSTCWGTARCCGCVWELREEPRRFRELQDLIGASPTIVNDRLADLRAAKLVELDADSGYRLTPLGGELLRLVLPLHAWSEKWARAVADDGPLRPNREGRGA